MSTKIKLTGGGVSKTVTVDQATITFVELKRLFNNVNFSNNRVYIYPDLDREIQGDAFQITLADYATNGEVRVGIVQKEMKAGAERTRAEAAEAIRQIRSKPGHSNFCYGYGGMTTPEINVEISKWERRNGSLTPAASLSSSQQSALTNMKRLASEVQTLGAQLVTKVNEFEALSSSFAGMSDSQFEAQLAAISRR